MKIKKVIISLICIFVVATMVSAGLTMNTVAVNNTSDNIISQGVYIADIDVSGMTQEEASSAVDAYMADLASSTITFKVDTHNIDVKASDLGILCTNMEVVQEALEFGKKGNIIQRYKALKDIEKEPKKYDLEITFDDTKISAIIEERCSAYDVEAKDASLKRENGSFVITPGQNGVGVDVASSAAMVSDYLNNSWEREDASIDLEATILEPKVTEASLKEVKDVLGTFQTSYTSSGASRSANVANGAKLIDGTVVMPGDTFSTYDTITPFTEENGYYPAGSYLMGKVVDSIGGGICQVSTTLYNAVLRAELDIAERHNHSMIVGYVDASEDASISESAGKDFKFVNSTDYPIYIESIVAGKTITFNIYGKETRESNRTIEFVSEILETTEPVGAKYSIDNTMLFGQQRQTQSAHTGYKAKLWKHIYVDGKETDVVEVNTSVYKAEPAYIGVGIVHGDEASIAALTAAVATNDPAVIDATLAQCAGAVNQAAALQAQLEAQAAQAAAQAAAGQ